MERVPKMSPQESVDESGYESVKAEAMASAAYILSEIGCPSDPTEMKEMDVETLIAVQENLQERITDMSSGESAQRDRLIVEYLSGYLRVAETLREGQQITDAVLANVERVEF